MIDQAKGLEIVKGVAHEFALATHESAPEFTAEQWGQLVEGAFLKNAGSIMGLFGRILVQEALRR